MVYSIVRSVTLTMLVLGVSVTGPSAQACWWPWNPWGGYGSYYAPSPMYSAWRPIYPAPAYYSAGYYGSWGASYAGACCQPACCNPCDPCSACGIAGCAGGGCGVSSTGSGTLKPAADPEFRNGTGRSTQPEVPPRTYEDDAAGSETRPEEPFRRRQPDPMDDFGRSQGDTITTPPVEGPGFDTDPQNNTGSDFNDILNNNRGIIEPFGEDNTRSSNKPPMTEPVPGDSGEATPAAGDESGSASGGESGTTTGGESDAGDQSGTDSATGSDPQSLLSIPEGDSVTLRRGSHREVVSHERFAGSAGSSPTDSVAGSQPSRSLRWISAPPVGGVVRL